MARKYRNRRTRKRTRTSKYNSKRPVKKVKVDNKRHLSNKAGTDQIDDQSNNADNNPDNDDDNTLPRPPYKKAKRLLIGGKPSKGDENEGKCRFQEDNSSSEEESAGLNKTRKVIDEEKKENTKAASRRNVPEAEDSPAKSKVTVEKHAKKVRKSKHDEEKGETSNSS